MFRGINAVNIDTKGRLAVPVRYRERLAAESERELVVTIDTDMRCLLLYPSAVWEVIEHKIEALPSFNPAARRIQRLLIGHATELELDSQGRILVPPLLRDYANLRERAVLIGQGKKFELWDEGQWQGCREQWLDEMASQKGELPPELGLLSL